MRKEIADKQELSYDTRGFGVLQVADGQELTVVGTMDLDANFQGAEATIRVLVVAGLAPDILLGWRDMVKLQMIPS